MNRKCARKILGIWKKVRVWSLSVWRRRLTFGARWGLTTGVEADGKVSIERLCLSPYFEKPFNSKVIKNFVPELRSRKVFHVSGFLCYLYMSYEYSMYISCMGMVHNYSRKFSPIPRSDTSNLTLVKKNPKKQT